MKRLLFCIALALTATITLQAQQVGIGTSNPENQLHVKDSVGEGQHVMLIENADAVGSGLKIRIDGSHPTWFPDSADYINWFEVIQEEQFIWLDDIVEAQERINEFIITGGLSFNFYQAIGDPYEFAGMELDTLAATLACLGASYLADRVDNLLPDSLVIGALDSIDLGAALDYSLTLPDLLLESIPPNIPNIPHLPSIASNTWTINVPDPVLDPPGSLGPWTIEIPPFNMPPSKLNNALEIPDHNDVIATVNTAIDDLNPTIENAHDLMRAALGDLDTAAIQFLPPIWAYEWDNTIALPSFQGPDSIGQFECPDPNPFEDGSISFGFIDYFCSNNPPTGSDSLYSVNHFITFVDKEDRQLGSISARSLCEGYLDYWDPATVFKLIPTSYGSIITMLGTYFGSLQNIDKIGVSYESGHGDYAEWLERIDHDEQIHYGDIVGIYGGRITRTLYGAEQVMVVSKTPIVLGNIPPAGREHDGNNVAFIGQVPVKVMGPVRSGDYISGNLETPGYGVAISPDDITEHDFPFVVGRSWETNEMPGFKYVNTIVGMHNNAWLDQFVRLQEKTRSLESRVDANEHILQSLVEKVERLRVE